jgi:hypothetical protein
VFLRKTAVILLLGAGITALSAYNHPELQWRTVSTRHFLIHYYDRAEPAVYATSKIAEESYDALAKLYTYTFKDRINLSLSDVDDYTNGFAEWTARNIEIFIPDIRFDLRGNNTWLRNVITHELAHIISLEKTGAQFLDLTIGVDYEADDASFAAQYPIPLTPFFPDWFTEGMAQHESERAGNDCWDARRDMLLRCAVLDGRELSLDEMGQLRHDSQGDELVYNQGFSLVGHIERRFGQKALAGMVADARSFRFGGSSFGAFFQRHTGADLPGVYRTWVDSLRAAYARQIPAAPTNAAIVWNDGAYNMMPRVSPNAAYWGFATSQHDDFGRTDLIIARKGSAAPVVRLPYVATDWRFSADGKSVYYLKLRDPDITGSYLNDLFVCDLDTRAARRITRGARLYDIAPLPGGKQLVASRYSKGAFSIVKYDLASGFISTVIGGAVGAPFAGLSVCPADANRLVASRIVNGRSDLYIVDIAAKTIAPLMATPFQEEQPCWGANGRIYFSADYGGVCDIYSVDSAGADLRRHSHARGGFFSPCPDNAGSLVCSEYASAGFRIVTIPDRGAQDSLASTEPCVFQALPQPKGRVTINSTLYRPAMLRPVFELSTVAAIINNQPLLTNADTVPDSLQTVVIGSFSWQRSDALHKVVHYVEFAVHAGTGVVAPPVSGFLPSEKHSNLPHRNRYLPALRMPAPPRDLALRMRGMDAPRRAASGDTFVSSTSPWFAPTLYYENHMGAPTFGGQIKFAFGELYFSTDSIRNINDLAYLEYVARPFIDWQVWRDLYIGIQPLADIFYIYPMGGQIPLYIDWSHVGYADKDISYTQRDAARLTAQIGPLFWPFRQLKDTGAGRIDTIAGNYPSTIGAGIAGSYGIPVFRHSSVVLDADFSGMWLQGRYLDLNKQIDGASDFYGGLDYGIRFVFPVARRIHRGKGMYADALYGNLFHSLSLFGNRRLLGMSPAKYFSDTEFDSLNVNRTAVVGAGVELGLSQSYLFTQTLSITGSWDLWKKRAFLSVGLGF